VTSVSPSGACGLAIVFAESRTPAGAPFLRLQLE
jgi:hypothetical protein